MSSPKIGHPKSVQIRVQSAARAEVRQGFSWRRGFVSNSPRPWGIFIIVSSLKIGHPNLFKSEIFSNPSSKHCYSWSAVRVSLEKRLRQQLIKAIRYYHRYVAVYQSATPIFSNQFKTPHGWSTARGPRRRSSFSNSRRPPGMVSSYIIYSLCMYTSRWSRRGKADNR